MNNRSRRERRGWDSAERGALTPSWLDACALAVRDGEPASRRAPPPLQSHAIYSLQRKQGESFNGVCTLKVPPVYTQAIVSSHQPRACSPRRARQRAGRRLRLHLRGARSAGRRRRSHSRVARRLAPSHRRRRQCAKAAAGRLRHALPRSRTRACTQQAGTPRRRRTTAQAVAGPLFAATARRSRRVALKRRNTPSTGSICRHKRRRRRSRSRNA